MKVIAAYLLAGLGGNASPSAADLKKILKSGARLLCRGWAGLRSAGAAADMRPISMRPPTRLGGPGHEIPTG
jgi:hypothetical protein